MTNAEPTEDVLAWVAHSLGARRADWVERLPGGQHAETSVIRVGDEELVLQEFPDGDPAVRREIIVLERLDGLDGLAPRLLAADIDGSEAGRPTIVTTRLPGSAELFPEHPSIFITELARALARIHALPLPADLPDLVVAPFAGESEASFTRLTGQPRVFSHNDYWSGNTLRVGGHLSGVVDWSGAGRAPRGHDIAWARQDLLILFGEAAADEFVGAYLAAVTDEVQDCVEAGVDRASLDLWDHRAALHADPIIESWDANYQDLDRADLDSARLREILDSWLIVVSRRVAAAVADPPE